MGTSIAAISALTLLVLPSGAWAATPGEYVGKTASSYEVRVSVGNDGLASQLAVSVTTYSVKCKQPPAYPGANQIKLLVQPPTLHAPFDASTATHFADTRRVKASGGWRWKTTISGDLSSPTQWQGTYKARAKNKNNHLRCRINTTWTAALPGAGPSERSAILSLATPGAYVGKLVGKTGSEKASVELRVGDDSVPFHFDVAPLKTKRCTHKGAKFSTPGQIFEAPFDLATTTQFVAKRPRHVVGPGIRIKERVTGAAVSDSQWQGTYLLDAKIGYPFKKNHCHFSTTWTATL